MPDAAAGGVRTRHKHVFCRQRGASQPGAPSVRECTGSALTDYDIGRFTGGRREIALYRPSADIIPYAEVIPQTGILITDPRAYEGCQSPQMVAIVAVYELETNPRVD